MYPHMPMDLHFAYRHVRIIAGNVTK